MHYTNNQETYRKIKLSGKYTYTNYQYIYRRKQNYQENSETSGKYNIQTIRKYTGRSKEKSHRYWTSAVVYPGHKYWDTHTHTQGTIH